MLYLIMIAKLRMHYTLTLNYYKIIYQFFTHPLQGVKNKADQKTGVLGKIGMGAQAGARRAKTTPYAPAGIYSG